MKTYTKPEMKLNAFPNENVLTSSGTATGTDAAMETWSEENIGSTVVKLDRNDMTLVF